MLQLKTKKVKNFNAIEFIGWTAEILGRIGEKSEATAPALIEALKDENVEVRQIAAEALGKIAPESIKETRNAAKGT